LSSRTRPGNRSAISISRTSRALSSRGIVSVGTFEHFTRPRPVGDRKGRDLSAVLRTVRRLADTRLAPFSAEHHLGNVPRDPTDFIMAQEVFHEIDPPMSPTCRRLRPTRSRSSILELSERLRPCPPGLAGATGRPAAEIEAVSRDGSFEFSERYLRRCIYGFKNKELQFCRFAFQRH
jgi:hypothetical protein